MSDDQQIDQLQDDIEQTRGDLAQTIGQIEERLSPSALQSQVTDIVQQLTDQLMSEFQGKSGELTSKINDQVSTAIQGVATSRVEQLIGQAGPAVGGVGKSLWSRLSENPAVGALAAVGIGLLAAEEGARRSGGGQEWSNASSGAQSGEGITTKLSSMASQATDALGGVVDTAKQQAQGITSGGQSSGSGSTPAGLGGMVSDQSLATGLLALGIGFLAGVAAPKTETERQAIAPLQGKANEQLEKMGVPGGSPQALLDQAKQTGTELLGQAKEQATGAVDAAKQTAGQAKQTAVDTAKQATSSGGSTSQS